MEKSFALTGIETPDYPARSIVAIPTTLPRIFQKKLEVNCNSNLFYWIPTVHTEPQ
jgi:hypothetical protein